MKQERPRGGVLREGVEGLVLLAPEEAVEREVVALGEEFGEGEDALLGDFLFDCVVVLGLGGCKHTW